MAAGSRSRGSAGCARGPPSALRGTQGPGKGAAAAVTMVAAPANTTMAATRPGAGRRELKTRLVGGVLGFISVCFIAGFA